MKNRVINEPHSGIPATVILQNLTLYDEKYGWIIIRITKMYQ